MADGFACEISSQFGKNGTWWTNLKNAWTIIDLSQQADGADHVVTLIEEINDALPEGNCPPDDPGGNPGGDPGGNPGGNPGGGNGRSGPAPQAPPTPPRDPLVIDLNGDGVKFRALAHSTTLFDIDNDGFRETVSWISPDDGFLVRDINNDGVINGLNELIGSAEEDGFAVLRDLDNGDGIFDANDAVFSSLKIWRDANSDGVSTADELKSLADYGITQIALHATSVDRQDGDVLVSHESVVETSDGAELDIVAAWFSSNQLLSRYELPEGLVVSGDALLVPLLFGYGNVADLQIAAAQDPTLLELVVGLVNNLWSLDADEIKDQFREVLFRWSSVDGVDPTGRGPHVDARELGVLEKIYDQSLTNVTPSLGDANYFHQIFDEISEGWLIRFLAQAGGSRILLSDDPVSEYENIQLEDVLFSSIGLDLPLIKSP